MSQKKVFFSIPLAAKNDSIDWDLLNKYLGLTLNSIFNQTDPDFFVYICCQDMPYCSEMNDPRIKFIKAEFPRPTDKSQFMRDKSRKRLLIAEKIKDNGGGYVVMHDADDLINKNLVEYMRRINSPYGYTYPYGYALDFKSKKLAPIPGAWKKSFHLICGSSAAIYFSSDDFIDHGDGSYYRKFKSHGDWPYVAHQAKRPLVPVPFPACIYLQNNSTNISAGLQRDDERQIKIYQSIEKQSIPVTREIIDDFALNWF